MKTRKELWATARRAALRVDFLTTVPELSLYAKAIFRSLEWADKLRVEEVEEEVGEVEEEVEEDKDENL